MPRHTLAQDRERARQAGVARQTARTQLMRGRVNEARTPEAALMAAVDWFRSSAARMSNRGKTRTGMTPNRPGAESAIRRLTASIVQAAIDLDAGVHDVEGGD